MEGGLSNRHNRYVVPASRSHRYGRAIDGVSTFSRPLVLPVRPPRTDPSTHHAHQPSIASPEPPQTPSQVLKPGPEKSKKSLLRHRSFKKITFIGLTACLAALSLYVSIDSLWTNHEAQATTPQEKNKGITAQPTRQADETPLSSDVLNTYSVEPSLPRIIRIESINVAARVLRMGVTMDNSLDTPKSAYDTGWYEGSAKPGEAGAILIDGHYTGDRGGQAIFHNIENLKPGALITIEKGNGTLVKYAVEKIQKLPVDQVPMAQLLAASSPHGQVLTLITCIGTYNPHTKTYDQRVIVQADILQEV